MPGLKITLLQQPLVWMDGPANLRHFDRQLEGITGRDVIVLPEMFTSGFAMEAAASSLAQDDVVNWMTAKALQAVLHYKRSLVRLTAFCWLSRAARYIFMISVICSAWQMSIYIIKRAMRE